MQIVIDISEPIYERIKHLETAKHSRSLRSVLIRSIQDGISLPEEHGELVDRDAINEEFYEYARYTDDSDKRQLDYFSQCLDTATAILPVREL